MDRGNISQRVYEQLHQKLRTGSIQRGAQLVNRKLAAELGTSTIPVREAISRLVSEGLLEFTPGAGAFVRSPDPNELGELYDVREALEALAAAEAARFATDHLIAELRAICELFQQVVASITPDQHATPAQFNRWLEGEELFHTRLVAASRNRWLVKTVKEVRVIGQVFAAQRATPELLTRAVAEVTLQHHEAFLEILASRDAEEARQWMITHIRMGRDLVLGHIASRAASDDSKD